ncbi:lanthionine synthetase C family protein [Streptomyces sp. NPDC090021]|uniref:lanthionine synthetase C family protein n=1 Tax=Streptomyces sp. NPDC090021 TaxID=3365919 RepID=UPI0037FD227B
MRNERWVHRSLFTWHDTLFFDPLDVFHEPDADHFLAGFDAGTRARFVREGIRWSHRHDPAPPERGPLIHVTAGRRNVREVATSVIRHLTDRGTDFEIALDPTVFAMCGDGRLATVYPQDEAEFRSGLAGLARLLEGVEGVRLLSDVRHRGGGALSFHHGAFGEVRTVDALGRRLPPAPGGDPRVAAAMADVILPVTAMSHLREDVLDLYRGFITEGLGWPERVHGLLVDLARDRIGLDGLLDALADEAELLRRVVPAVPRPGPSEGPDGAEAAVATKAAEAAVAAFVEAAADTGRDTLFPVDPFAHVTNPLSLGSGASGVLWALHACGVPVRPEWRDWLGAALAGIDPAHYPDGLMNGLAGIAWAADSLGFGTLAGHLLDRANGRVTEQGDPSFHHGLAGVGMTNLRFFLRGHDPRRLAAAQGCARALHDTARRDGGRAYWPDGAPAREPRSGLGSGPAGVAVFLLRMHQISGEERHLSLGREALAWETARLTTAGDGGGPDPYVESGAAGLAKVLLRYGDLAAARTVLRGLDLRYAAGPGYASGMCGVADTLLDAADFTGDAAYLGTALRQLDFVRQVFLFEPSARFGLRSPDGHPLLGVPGEGLLRCSTDYLTGSAGVLRLLHRVNSGGTADFLLDEVGPPQVLSSP